MPSSPKPPSSRERSGEIRGRDDLRLLTQSPVETLLRSLLSATSRGEAGASVVEGTRSLLDVEWVALYQTNEGVWVCRFASGAGPSPGDALPEPPPPIEGAGPFRLPGDAAVAGATLAVPLRITAEGAGLLLIGPRTDGRDFASPAMHILSRVVPDMELVLRKADDLEKLRSQAFLDSLTNCYNRRGFDEHLHVELLRAKRYDRPLALMLVDLDAFKCVNDELGHQSGDHVIRSFASLLSHTFRTTDVISRYGGDEFAIIFPETTREDAAHLAERIRLLVGEAFPDSQIPRRVTASFGVAAYPADAAVADDLVASADRALYAAKTRGRDRVVAADQLVPPKR